MGWRSAHHSRVLPAYLAPLARQALRPPLAGGDALRTLRGFRTSAALGGWAGELDNPIAVCYAKGGVVRGIIGGVRGVSKWRTVRYQRWAKCAVCGVRVDYDAYVGGRPPKYCDACRAEVKREQARERVAAMRRRRGG